MAPRCFETFIYETAFIGMIVSAVEVYPNECLGSLLGYRAWNSTDKTRRAIIENAISYQTAERSKNGVEVRTKHELRCKDMLYKLCSLESVGDFHSHPDWNTTPSSTDFNNMDVGNIEVIISVNPKKRTTPWTYNPNTKELRGVFGDYRFSIAAYSCFNKKGSVNHEKIEIVCPFALGVGSKFMDTNASMLNEGK